MVDTTGAGDAFVGYLVAGLASGLQVSAALPDAVAAGALAVTRPGALAAVPTRQELSPGLPMSPHAGTGPTGESNHRPDARGDPMQHLRTATDRVSALLDGVDEAGLGVVTPNDGTSVEMLLQHLLGLSVAFRDAAAKVQGPTTQTPPAPVTDPLPTDWRQALARQLGELAVAWQDPGAWDGMTTVGGVTLPAEVCGLVALDEVLLHGWDLAVATGQAYVTSEAEAEAVLPVVTPGEDAEAEAAAREGMFGPPLPVPDGATPFERVLALSGRDPRWTIGA